MLKNKIVLYGYRCFVVYVKTDDIYKDIVEDIENRLDASSYELERPMSRGKNKKVIDLIKSELGEKNITKTCSYLIDDDSKDKKLSHKKKP